MPELPEVETITNRLRPVLINQSFSEIISHHPKTLQGDHTLILHQPIVEVTRRGKMIRIQFANEHNLLIHLKMTGQIIFLTDGKRIGGGHPTNDWIEQLPAKHTRTEFRLRSQELNQTLFFNDQRLFGWLKILTDKQVHTEFAKLGPDANADDFTLEPFAEKLKRKSIPIKVAIMDNAIVSGVGNIYANDSLNLARISPFTPAKELTSDQVKRLYKSIRLIIQKGIFLGGATTDGKYINIDGMAGKYQLEARVYNRTGDPCLYCQGEIRKTKLGGRGTYHCVGCQVPSA